MSSYDENNKLIIIIFAACCVLAICIIAILSVAITPAAGGGTVIALDIKDLTYKIIEFEKNNQRLPDTIEELTEGRQDEFSKYEYLFESGKFMYYSNSAPESKRLSGIVFTYDHDGVSIISHSDGVVLMHSEESIRNGYPRKP